MAPLYECSTLVQRRTVARSARRWLRVCGVDETIRGVALTAAALSWLFVLRLFPLRRGGPGSGAGGGRTCARHRKLPNLRHSESRRLDDKKMAEGG